MTAQRYSATIRATYFALGLGLLPLQPGLTVSFSHPSDNAAPRQESGGASRGRIDVVPSSHPDENALLGRGLSDSSHEHPFFIPLPDNAAPTQTFGGARDATFSPRSENLPADDASGGDVRTNQYGLTNDVLTGASVNMMAVTPQNFYGLTMTARPTFMAYLPASAADQAVFRLKDQSHSIVYEQIIPLDGNAGILRVTMPQDAPELELEKYYQWFITLQTGENMTPSSPFVDAWIKRIDRPSAIAQVQAAGDALTTVEYLAQAGIWYDAAAILSTLHQDGSPEIAAHWTELLTSVELGDLTGASLLFRETP